MHSITAGAFLIRFLNIVCYNVHMLLFLLSPPFHHSHQNDVAMCVCVCVSHSHNESIDEFLAHIQHICAYENESIDYTRSPHITYACMGLMYLHTTTTTIATNTDKDRREQKKAHVNEAHDTGTATAAAVDVATTDTPSLLLLQNSTFDT